MFFKYHGKATGTGTPVAAYHFVYTVDKAAIAERRNGLASVEVLRNR